MFVVEHVDGQGWGPPTIKPFGNLAIHPAAQTLHYGLCCFEGMKGYLGADKKARLFRWPLALASTLHVAQTVQKTLKGIALLSRQA